MSWVYEIALRGAPDMREALANGFQSGPRQALAALPGLASIDLYTPAEGPARDPYNQDGTGPLMLLMLGYAARGALAAAVHAGQFSGALVALPPGIAATGAAFERRFYPVGGEAKPAALRAPFSYVVRYHRPAADEAAFIDNYLATHPVTQAKLPGIRSIMCYLPLDALPDVAGQSAGRDLPLADYMIGNEVVFDDLAAFNVAMASPVRQELRAHYRAFPPFTGANTHFPMTRIRLFG
jgi:hypothetical protein